MNRRVSQLLGLTRAPSEDTPLWSGITSALAAVFAGLLALLIGLPLWTVILFFALAVVALGILAWRLVTDGPPRHREGYDGPRRHREG
jgi:membrane protein implicated in regulation of membrane protease activity